MKLRILLCCIAGLIVPATSALAAPLAGDLARKLDPRLQSALAEDAAAVPVWVEFTDKGEQGVADLQARLREAERALTERARARRQRAGMSPIVDYADLPLHAPYLEALEADGYALGARSRWFNRVSLHAGGAALARLAGYGFVARIERPPLALPTARPREEAAAIESVPAASAGALRAGGAAAIAYGQTATQLARIGAPALHDSGYDGTGVLICVLDEGFNFHTKHSATRDLPVLATRDFVRGVVSVQDTVQNPGFFRHGQWCLSVIGGRAPGAYAGPAFDATFMLGRTENSASETLAELTLWAMGAEWADSAGADIISSSLGYRLMDDPAQSIPYSALDGRTTVVTRAAALAASRGILVVNSAGNDGSNPAAGYKISAPADAHGDSVLAIGATDSLGVRASYSSKGPTFDGRVKPDLVAQGSSVLLASASGGANVYTRLSGTSFSCPQIAGLAACLMEARPNMPATLILRALRESADRAANPDTLYGYGRPDGGGALDWLADTAGVPGGSRTSALALAGPNPFVIRVGTRVRFTLPAGAGPGAADLRVLDLAGRTIRRLWSGALLPGEFRTAAWDGLDDQGRAVRPGLYLLGLEAAGQRSSLRVAALR